MRSKLLLHLIIWYRKWILGECRHLCSYCMYSHECKQDESWWGDLSTIGYYDKDNYGERKDDWR